LNSSASALYYSTFFGGIIDPNYLFLKIDEYNNLYLAGHTNSSDFPYTTGAYDTVAAYGKNFIAKLNLCTGAPSLQSASAAAAFGNVPSYTYLWANSTLLTDSSVAHPSTIALTNNTRFIVTVTDALGCTSRDTVDISVNPQRIANAGKDTASGKRHGQLHCSIAN
jgi:hypothetical protein